MSVSDATTADAEAATSFASLGLDGTLLVLRQLDRLSDALQLATVSHCLAAAVRAHVATLEHLELEPDTCGDDEQLDVWLSHTPALKSLQLGGLKELHLGAPGRLCFGTQLQRIGLSETMIDAEGLLHFWRTLPHLRALDLSDCPNLEGHSVMRLINEPPLSKSVAELSLARCPQMTSDAATQLCCLCGASLATLDLGGYDDFGAADAQRLFETCGPALRDLSLIESEGVSHEIVSSLATHAPRLRALDLSWCFGVDTGAAQALAAHCPRLEELDLRCCSNVQAAKAIAAIGQGDCCIHMTMLCLNRTDAYAASDDCERMPSLGEALDGGEVQDAASAHLAPLLCLTALRVLDLGWLTELVTDDSLDSLLRGLPKLSVLSVEGCKMLSDRALDVLLAGAGGAGGADEADGANEPRGCEDSPATLPCLAPSLVRLNLAWVDGVTDAGVRGALHAACAHEARARRGQQRSPQHDAVRGAELQILDYFGRCWGARPDGSVAKCKLRVSGRGVPHVHALKGWVNAYDDDLNSARESTAHVVNVPHDVT